MIEMASLSQRLDNGHRLPSPLLLPSKRKASSISTISMGPDPNDVLLDNEVWIGRTFPGEIVDGDS